MTDQQQSQYNQGEIFIDRDGKTFEMLLNYLRNERKIIPLHGGDRESPKMF